MNFSDVVRIEGHIHFDPHLASFLGGYPMGLPTRQEYNSFWSPILFQSSMNSEFHGGSAAVCWRRCARLARPTVQIVLFLRLLLVDELPGVGINPLHILSFEVLF